MGESSFVGTVILLITGLVTYQGFRDSSYRYDYIFDVDKILRGKEYIRLISSGFLHANWIHFGFNMIALLGFSLSVENSLGTFNYLLIYFISMIGGNLFALYIHKEHGDYRALGASGAISGIVLASIVLLPSAEISFILIPGSMPSWVFAILFVLISIWGIKSQEDNIGHEAHLGGAVIGVLCVLILQPTTFMQNWWIAALILVPTILFLILLIRSPNMLIISNYWGDDIQKFKAKLKQNDEDPDLDYLLDKINKKGIDSLSRREKELLDNYRKNL
ncbi:MAG: rhomboid family intramembrane serine protease [Saprospiraceae bacterium]|nr:rhomboid family intramembrane serine protease [Saprospiraceae bacterium]